ncbi:MAG: long-chain-fatty-acid--CoA ligase [Caldilineaceae bacterium]
MYITQGLKRAVQINGNGIATIDGDRQRTWREVAQRVAKLAGALRQLGLSPGGRVAILSLNSDRYLETYYAVPWANGILVPLNTRLTPMELIFMLNDAGVEILIVDEAFKAMLPAFAGKLATVQQIIYASDVGAPEGVYHYETMLEAARSVPDAERGGEEVACIFYTGGTTGLPKGVMLTHDNIMCNTMYGLIASYQGTPWIWLHVAPMFHLADASAIPCVTAIGGTHVFIPKFDPGGVLKAIERHRVTLCILVPVMINLLVHDPEIQHRDLSCFQRMIYGGSAMSPALLAKAMSVLPHCQFVQYYGMTEAAPGITILESQHHVFEGPLVHRINACGWPLYMLELKIVDAEDRELPPHSIGEIVVRGPNVMKGYWNRPEETARTLRNGWLHTGDAGYLDEDGFLYIVDRYKDMIKTGGENVFSIEVENAIYQHPAVAMCAVIAVPDEKWGEAVHAIVVPKADHSLSVQEIIDHCRTLIAGYKCPRSVEIRREPLPISGAGKVMKGQLREPYWQGHERRVA